MGDEAPASAPAVRAAEIASALCLATDLGMGFPWAHGLAATTVTMRLADLADVDERVRKQAYYLSLLLYAGCTADAARKADIFGGPVTESIVGVIWGQPREQLRVVLRELPDPGAHPIVALGQVGARLPRAVAHQRREQLALCEVAQVMSRRLGVGPLVAEELAYLTDRWDGAGTLHRARGDEIPLALRIALVARDASYHASVGGSAHAAEVVARRAGHAHDPRLARLVARHHAELLAGPEDAEDVGALWEQVLSAEPGHRVDLPDDQVDEALATLGEMSDLVSPETAGRSRAVAALAAAAAGRLGLRRSDVADVRRAALLQDVGRVGVPPRVWARHGRWSPQEWEQVRLHPYWTERVCRPSPALRRLGADAACHHERLDGSGYHRGVGAPALGPRARLLAAADALRTATEQGGPALSRSAAAAHLAREVDDGRLDADAVAAVVAASGTAPAPVRRPAGLTEREALVLSLVARGLATKQAARALGISPKTADQHLQHAYRKIGTSSRAAAALFVAEHGLLAWGELRIPAEDAAT